MHTRPRERWRSPGILGLAQDTCSGIATLTQAIFGADEILAKDNGSASKSLANRGKQRENKREHIVCK
jgi:hypothetical protein